MSLECHEHSVFALIKYFLIFCVLCMNTCQTETFSVVVFVVVDMITLQMMPLLACNK